MKKLLLAIVTMACVLGVAATPAAASGEVPCFGSTCNGLDPQATGCSSDLTVLGSFEANTTFVELRKSAKCHAVWTRYKVKGLAFPATAQIIGSSHTYLKNVANYTGEVGWTKMVSFDEVVKSCLLWNGNSGYSQTCTHSY